MFHCILFGYNMLANINHSYSLPFFSMNRRLEKILKWKWNLWKENTSAFWNIQGIQINEYWKKCLNENLNLIKMITLVTSKIEMIKITFNYLFLFLFVSLCCNVVALASLKMLFNFAHRVMWLFVFIYD